MATTISTDDILKAAQAMTKEQRLKLIAEIAALPEVIDGPLPEAATLSSQEVMELTRQFMNQHKTLLRRLAQ